jgi:hypothetical protein
VNFHHSLSINDTPPCPGDGVGKAGRESTFTSLAALPLLGMSTPPSTSS